MICGVDVSTEKIVVGVALALLTTNAVVLLVGVVMVTDGVVVFTFRTVFEDPLAMFRAVALFWTVENPADPATMPPEEVVWTILLI